MAEYEDLTPQISKHKSIPRNRVEREGSQQVSDLKPAKATTKIIAEHTVGGGETLSHISLNYYGSASKPYWMVIYAANRELIGDNPNKFIKCSITLKIPELPAELKK